MRLLLDTHIALWALTDDPRLSARARSLIEDPANQVLVSAATVWEIAIKHALARTDMPISGAEALDWFRLAGYDLLPISPEHAAAVERLPNHHRDPFDRLLVAQAQTEPLRLLRRDPLVIRYGEAVLPFERRPASLPKRVPGRRWSRKLELRRRGREAGASRPAE